MAGPLPIGREPTAEPLRLALIRLLALPGDLSRIMVLAARLGRQPAAQREPPGSDLTTR